MFNNIGRKTMGLSKFLAWFGIIASIIAGIIVYNSVPFYNSESVLFPAILTALLGSLVSWIGSFFLYGFGQLVDDVSALRGQIAPDVLASVRYGFDTQFSAPVPVKKDNEAKRSAPVATPAKKTNVVEENSQKSDPTENMSLDEEVKYWMNRR